MSRFPILLTTLLLSLAAATAGGQGLPPLICDGHGGDVYAQPMVRIWSDPITDEPVLIGGDWGVRNTVPVGTRVPTGGNFSEIAMIYQPEPAIDVWQWTLDVTRPVWSPNPEHPRTTTARDFDGDGDPMTCNNAVSDFLWRDESLHESRPIGEMYRMRARVGHPDQSYFWVYASDTYEGRGTGVWRKTILLTGPAVPLQPDGTHQIYNPAGATFTTAPRPDELTGLPYDFEGRIAGFTNATPWFTGDRDVVMLWFDVSSRDDWSGVDNTEGLPW